MAQNLADILSQIRGGTALHEAGIALQECVQATRDTGKASKLTFTITIEPDKGDETAVTLQPDITVKLPKKQRAKGIFFVDGQGRLYREDPRQTELELERKEKLAEQGATALTQVGRG
jgi:hypothetical protein